MRTIVALFALVGAWSGALPLFAQYGPPAKDLDDARFFMQELRRQLEPAMNDARDQAEVFHLVARATNKLIGKLPASEITDAIKLLDDYIERRERASKPLSRENVKTIASVRKELELAQPPYAIPALRERLHHEFVHNLERQSLANLKRIEQLKEEWAFLVERSMDPATREVLSGVAAAAKED